MMTVKYDHYRKYEVVGIDGLIFHHLKQQAHKEHKSVEALIEDYLLFGLFNKYEVQKINRKPIN